MRVEACGTGRTVVLVTSTGEAVTRYATGRERLCIVPVFRPYWHMDGDASEQPRNRCAHSPPSGALFS